MGGRPVPAVLGVLCLISLTTQAAAFRVHDFRRGLEQAVRGRLLADATAGGVVVPIHWSQSYYVVNYTIGTPPQPASGIIDLFGELVWTQCPPCRGSRGGCFGQDLPLFNPDASSTFRPVACGTPLCESIPTRNCSATNVCTYEASTSAGDDTFGVVGYDTFAVGTNAATLGFGCVVASQVDSKGLGGPSGFVGLGRTPWSLVSQLNVTAFSYCLAPHDAGKNSALFLGPSAKLGGGGKIATTPFIVNTSNPDINDGLSRFYRIHLEGIKAGDAPIATPAGGSTVLLNTFSPFSFLADTAYQALKKAVTAQIGVAPTPPPVKGFELCFPKAGVSGAKDLVFTFRGAAALTVPPSNYLFDVDNSTACLAIWSSSLLTNSTAAEELSILGSLQQENVHFLYDLDKETLSFQPADCTTLS